MRLSPDDQKRFKKLSKWVEYQAPSLGKDPVVVDTMDDLVGVEPRVVRTALQWSHGPLIRVVPELICRSRAAGCFRPANPDQIEIEQQMVDAYESGLPMEVRSTGLHRVPRPGIILLHELVHWADFQANGRRTEVGPPYHDIASKWEWLVFATFLQEMSGD